MNKILDIVLAEPVRAAAIALVVAAVATAEAFGFSFDAEQKAALGALGIAALALAEVVRRQVSPKNRGQRHEQIGE
jgi:hypothetical protein